MRTKKSIIILAIVFLVLTAAFIFVNKYDPDNNSNVGTSENVIFTEDINNIKEISVVNQFGTYSFTNSDSGFTFSETSDNVDTTSISSLFNAFTKLSVISVVSDSYENLADYGLSEPQSTVSLTTKNGQIEFYLGDKVATGNAYYLRTSKSNAIYLLSTSVGNLFCQKPDAFRNLTIVLADPQTIKTVSIVKNGEKLSLSYHQAPEGSYPGAVSEWRITSPLDIDADNQLVYNNILTALSTISADEVAADNVTDLSSFGFTGDSVTATTDTEIFAFSVGYKDNETFIRPDNKNTVYKIDPSKLSFMNIKPFDIIEKLINLISLDDVKTIKIINQDAEYNMETENYKIDGVTADEKAFKSMYSEIVGMSVDGMAEKPTNNTSSAATILISKTDGSVIKLEYCPYDDLNYSVYENGECRFYMKKTKLSSMLEKLKTFKNDPTKRVN